MSLLSADDRLPHLLGLRAERPVHRCGVVTLAVLAGVHPEAGQSAAFHACNESWGPQPGAWQRRRSRLFPVRRGGAVAVRLPGLGLSWQAGRLGLVEGCRRRAGSG
jgi:hypothetical protein